MPIRAVMLIGVVGLLFTEAGVGFAQERETSLDAPLNAREADDARRRAAAIADRYWDEEPFPAARNRCIELWRLLGISGYASARDRLYVIARTDSEDWYNASRSLHQAGDNGMVEYLIALAQDPDKPLSERKQAMALSGRFYNFGFERVPLQVELLCLEVIEGAERGDESINALRSAVESLAANVPSPDSIEPLERVVRQQVRNGVRYGNSDPDSNVACVAIAALNAVVKVGEPQSMDLYEWVMENSPWTALRLNAAEALLELDEVELAETGLLLAMAQNDHAPRSRLGDAFMLVRAGNESARADLLAGMQHPNEDVRATAYSLLCRLGDPVFIERAAHDYDKYDKPVGFYGLGGQGFSKDDSVRSLQTQYMQALARDGENSWTREIGLSLLITVDEAAEDALEIALPVLDTPEWTFDFAEDAPNEILYAWQGHVTKHMAILRFGSPDQQAQAFERLKRIYHGSKGRHYQIVHGLGWTHYRSAQRFLYEQMQTPLGDHGPLVQLSAAISYFAIETGNVPQ